MDDLQALQNAMDKLNHGSRKKRGVWLTEQEARIIRMNMTMLIRN